ncbi:MAG: aminoacyl-tRNA hydrolase [Clostridia bacterium]|nr:aminoacyl-tRNA hydrolase [Clostridia bacterium]
MFLIAGLGNPEPQYSQTRHNVGFDIVNILAKKYNIEINKNGYEGLYGIGTIEGEKVIILKPQTFMNESGKSVIKAKSFYNIADEKTIVIYDDIDIEEGVVKLRKKGGPGTHNGMKSVVSELNSIEFPRVRIGIGQPIFKDLMISYVIQKLSDEQYEKLKPAIQKASDAVIEIIKNGIDNAMNKFN